MCIDRPRAPTVAAEMPTKYGSRCLVSTSAEGRTAFTSPVDVCSIFQLRCLRGNSIELDASGAHDLLRLRGLVGEEAVERCRCHHERFGAELVEPLLGLGR